MGSTLVKKMNFKYSFIYIVLFLFAITNIYPIIWMVMNSLKTSQDFSINKLGLPRKFVIQNYIDAWNTANFKDFFINSIIVSIIAIIITVLFSVLTVYFLLFFIFIINAHINGFFIFILLLFLFIFYHVLYLI